MSTSIVAVAEPRVTARSPEAAVYVHPMVRRSAYALSPKSLSMCTESLGNETGVGSEVIDCSFHVEAESEKRLAREPRRRRSRVAVFPPPLTSLGDVRLKSHREDGKFVLTAEIVASTEPFFRAMRTQGRLILQLIGSEPSRAAEEEVKMKLGKYGRCTEGNNNSNSDENDRVLLGRPYLVAT